ncbi:terminase gpA endonuclease subunit [Thalassobaculum sp.]|uniref:terminase gpA endonuclease subunit n=1 Tax=Thalassobaculum sp. TaxID=2022740 RepID=UPI0032ED74A1
MPALDRTIVAEPFASPAAIFARASDELRIVAPIPADEAALQHMLVDDARVRSFRQMSYDRAPYLRRPLQAASSGLYSTTAIVGPAQSGKSTLGLGFFAWALKYSTGNFLWLYPDENTARQFSSTKFRPTVENSPDLAERHRHGNRGLPLFEQKWRGMVSWFVWPVAAQLRMKSARYTLADDYDAMPDDIEGEGSPYGLLEARRTAYEGRDHGMFISSPSKGRDHGIEALVASGTDERFCIPCPHHGDYFEPDFLRDLRFERTDNAADAEASAHVRCPLCGERIEPRQKAGIVARGVYAGAGQTVAADGSVSGELPRTSVASFRIDGLVAFTSWPKLAAQLRAAELVFERTQDEGDLKSVVNTKGGRNYVPRNAGKKPLEAADLAVRVAEGLPRGVVPADARYLTAAVDVQHNRFAVLVVAWGLNREAWIIDRFDIVADDRGEGIAPARSLEAWEVLGPRVLDAVYPIDGRPGFGFWPAVVQCDAMGLPGTTEHARAYYRRLRGRGVPEWRLLLTSGHRSVTAPPLGDASFEKDAANRRLPDAVPIVSTGVNRLKTTLDNRLRFATPGGGFVHFYRAMPAEYLDELTSEIKVGDRWQKRADHLPNETLDLMVGAMAAELRLRVEKVKWDRPPVWARPVPLSSTVADEAAVAPRPDDGAAVARAPAARTVAGRPGRRMRSQGV